MITKVAEESVPCSFHLTNKTLWFLEALADKLTRTTGGVIQITRTEVLEMAIRQMAKAHSIR